MKWIGECAAIASYSLHHFDYLKGNQSRYFLEVFSIHGPQKKNDVYVMGVIYLQPTTCYYLGTFANQWSTAYGQIVYPHMVNLTTDIPMGNNPEIQGTYLAKAEIDEFNSLEGEFGKENLIFYLWPEKMPGLAYEAFFAEPHGIGAEIGDAITKMAFFYGKSDVVQWLRQKYILEARKLRFKLCVEKRYPPPSKTPQYQVKDPRGPTDFPGIPINQMDLPAPEVPAGRPIPIGQKRFRLTLIFTTVMVGTFNGYWLRVDVEEVV